MYPMSHNSGDMEYGMPNPFGKVAEHEIPNEYKAQVDV